MSARPNILLIEVDQWSPRYLSCLGDPNVRTPNLDALAERGTLFTNAVCQNPACMPSRASMLTGQYCSTNKQFGFVGLCDRRSPSMPRTFQQAGYRTGAWGKFHALCLGAHTDGDGWTFDDAAPTLGEDEDMARPAGNTYRAYCQKHGVPWPTDQMHGHNPFGPANQRPSSSRSDMHDMQRQSCMSDVPLEHSLETWTTNRCIDFLRDCAKRGQPFFGWLTYDRPHHPSTLPREWFEKIRPDKLRLPTLPSAQDMMTWPGSLFREARSGTSVWNVGEEVFRFILATYLKLIEWIDAEIGRVIEELKKLNLLDNTIIVFTSDHGDDAGWSGLYGKSAGCSSPDVVGVPLIITVPGGQPGQRLAEPVELVDLFPTLCALTGLEIPAGVEGRDLSAALRGQGTLDPHRGVICEQWYRKSWQKDGWRLVFDKDNPGERQLYDIRNDREQHRNRYNDPECLERRISLKQSLLAFLCERHFGPWTQQDRRRIERGLDPEDPTLPLVGGGGALCRVVPFRAAVLIESETGPLLVPFWDEKPMLLSSKAYPKRTEARPYDPAKVDELMDVGLVHLMNLQPTLSVLMLGYCQEPPPTARDVEALWASRR